MAIQHVKSKNRPERASCVSLLGCLVLVISSSVAQATEPTLPLSFLETPEQEMSRQSMKDPVDVYADLEQVADIQLKRSILSKGKVVSEKVLKMNEKDLLRAKGNGTLRFQISSNKEAPLAPGVYSETLLLEGRWKDEPKESPPIQVQYRNYFLVEKGKVKSVSLQEYSNLVDVPQVGLDSSGNQVLIHSGASRETAKEKRTENHTANFDTQLGNLGGIPLEQPSTEKNVSSSLSDRIIERDLSEVDEK